MNQEGKLYLPQGKMNMNYNEFHFRSRMEVSELPCTIFHSLKFHCDAIEQEALKKIVTVLGHHKKPVLDIHHQYEDKFSLTEILGNIAITATVNALQNLGLTREILSGILSSHSDGQEVSLQFKTKENRTFLREEEVEEDSKTSSITTITKEGEGATKFESKIIRRRKEYFWKVEVEYELFVVRGTGGEGTETRVCGNRGEREKKTLTNEKPTHTSSWELGPRVPLTWILSKINEDSTSGFAIDRRHPACHTCRRNPNVDDAMTFFTTLREWAHQVDQIFHRIIDNHRLGKNGQNFFNPIIPMFEDRVSSTDVVAQGEDESHPRPLFSPADINALIAEQVRTLNASLSEASSVDTDGLGFSGLGTPMDAHVVEVIRHLMILSESFYGSMMHIEAMLRRQLIQAVGKELTADDFDEYMQYHYRKVSHVTLHELTHREY